MEDANEALENYDRDGDGTLSEAEVVLMLKDLRRRIMTQATRREEDQQE